MVSGPALAISTASEAARGRSLGLGYLVAEATHAGADRLLFHLKPVPGRRTSASDIRTSNSFTTWPRPWVS